MSDINAFGRTPQERFWAKVDRSAGPAGCWPWMGARANGYGRVTLARRVYGAHRVALEWQLGRSLRVGEVAMHSCDNPPCVNPAHLSAVPAIVNDRDKVAKGRSNHGERHGHARLTEATVTAIREEHARTGEPHQTIADRHGLPRRLVSRIISRERWTHL